MENEQLNTRSGTTEDKTIIEGTGIDKSDGEAEIEGTEENTAADWRHSYLNSACYAFATLGEMDGALKGKAFKEKLEETQAKCFDIITWVIDDLHNEFEESE